MRILVLMFVIPIHAAERPATILDVLQSFPRVPHNHIRLSSEHDHHESFAWTRDYGPRLTRLQLGNPTIPMALTGFPRIVQHVDRYMRSAAEWFVYVVIMLPFYASSYLE